MVSAKAKTMTSTSPLQKIIKQYLPEGATLLDYGCGVCGFLQALSEASFVPFGVEFDKDAAYLASQRAGLTLSPLMTSSHYLLKDCLMPFI